MGITLTIKIYDEEDAMNLIAAMKEINSVLYQSSDWWLEHVDEALDNDE